MVRELSFRSVRCSDQCRLDLVFFVGIPAVLAATMSVVGGYVDLLGVRGGLLYVTTLSFVPWWIAGVATQLAHTGLRRFRLPLWALTAIGAVSASLVLIPIAHELNGWFRANWPGGQLLREMSWPVTVDRVREIAMSVGRATVLWTAFSYVFAATLGWSRYQYEPRSTATPVPVSDDAPPSRFGNSGHSWTGQDDAQLAAHVAAGLGPIEIARRMYRTVAAVRVRIAKIRSGARDPSD
jgi:hypothetical protein